MEIACLKCMQRNLFNGLFGEIVYFMVGCPSASIPVDRSDSSNSNNVDGGDTEVTEKKEGNGKKKKLVLVA